MKALRIILFALITSVIFSCAKSESPVTQIVDILNETTRQITDASDPAESREAIKAAQTESTKKINEILEKNKDYKLTDADKTELKEAMKKTLTASAAKALPAGTLSQADTDAMVTNIFTSFIAPAIDNAHLLGELSLNPRL